MKNFQMTLCVAALLGGIIALLNWGATPPPWLAGTEAALIMGVALSYGFTARLPRVPWLRMRPVRGTLLVALGSIMVFVQPQLIVAAYLIGRGIRLVWLSACQAAAEEQQAAAQPRTAVERYRMSHWTMNCGSLNLWGMRRSGHSRRPRLYPGFARRANSRWREQRHDHACPNRPVLTCFSRWKVTRNRIRLR